MSFQAAFIAVDEEDWSDSARRVKVAIAIAFIPPLAPDSSSEQSPDKRYMSRSLSLCHVRIDRRLEKI